MGLWVVLLHTGVQLSLVSWYRLETHPEVGLRGKQIHWESLLASTVEAQRTSPKNEYMSSSCLWFWLLTSYWLKQVTWQSSNVRAAQHKVSCMAKPHVGAMRTYTSHSSVMEVGGGRKVNVWTVIKPNTDSFPHIVPTTCNLISTYLWSTVGNPSMQRADNLHANFRKHRWLLP